MGLLASILKSWREALRRQDSVFLALRLGSNRQGGGVRGTVGVTAQIH